MKVYRLEHKESGVGFFWHKNKSGDDKYYFSDAGTRIYERCNSSSHPNTRADFGKDKAEIAHNNNWIHGCYTINQFFAWFEKDWYELIGYGFGLFEYEIDNNSEYFIGKTQVVFNPRVAVSRTELSIAEYEEALK